MSRRFRVINGEVVEVTHMRLPETPGLAPPIVSDNAGFPDHCLEHRKQQLAASGCTGIEFKEDPQVEGFYQVHASDRKAFDRYLKTRGMVNRTGSLGGGVMLSQDDLDRARELVSR